MNLIRNVVGKYKGPHQLNDSISTYEFFRCR